MSSPVRRLVVAGILVLTSLILSDSRAYAQSKISKAKVWVNAFIPKDIKKPDGTSMTIKIPGTGQHGGKTAIRGPFPGISDCFLTDQRGFSSKSSDSARLHHEVTVDVAAGSFVEAKRCDASIEVDCEDGDEECNHAASTDDLKLLNFKANDAPGGGKTISFQLKGAARNGCFTGAPQIDWDLSVALALAPGAELLTASVEGKLDKFPAFEMYVSVDGQEAAPLFQVPPPPGNTPGDLPGGASEPIKGEKKIGAPFNGLWKSQDAAKRFEINVSGTSVKWLERRPSGATLTREATLSPVSSGSNTYRIERPNDDAILQFLEFPDASLRAQIISAGAQPSYLLLTRQDDKIKGEWHGLLVKKKPNGHLDSLVQPKDSTAKIFEFNR